jgi:hypothetical protein
VHGHGQHHCRLCLRNFRQAFRATAGELRSSAELLAEVRDRRELLVGDSRRRLVRLELARIETTEPMPGPTFCRRLHP